MGMLQIIKGLKMTGKRITNPPMIYKSNKKTLVIFILNKNIVTNGEVTSHCYCRGYLQLRMANLRMQTIYIDSNLRTILDTSLSGVFVLVLSTSLNH